MLSGEIATHIGSMEDLSTTSTSRHRKSGSTTSAMSGLTADSSKSAETSDSTEGRR
ncbi:MAG: hypothetical protein V8Q79_10125 [Christensenellales bacterium]